MCNIAGYVGTRDAAPILIDMIKCQEAYCGGYYTGIATLHNGKIHYAKLTGDTDRLVSLTNALSLPGNIGIIHSRSNSGGGDSWAHPFIGRNGRTAYVANGTMGFAKPRHGEYTKIADALVDNGYDMVREHNDNPRYPHLTDGSTVHMSDVMCQLITSKIDGGRVPVTAMADAFCEMPSEIVGLLLSLDSPDSITYSRINYPMTLAFASHGAYLSSTPAAMPSDAGRYIPLPALSAGSIYKDKYTVVPFERPPVTVASITADVCIKVRKTVADILKDTPVKFGVLEKSVKPLFDSADCVPAALAVYETLYSMQNLKTEPVRLDGAREGLTAPKYMLSVGE